jgi:glycosyltransferase involved in cell wall biosynthesis
MTILMIAPTPFFSDRGCHVRIEEEARLLQGLGHRVDILTYGLGRDRPGLSIHRITRLPGYQKKAPGASIYKFPQDLLLRWLTDRMTKSRRPDLIWAHLHEGVYIAEPVARAYQIPLWMDRQGSLVEELASHGTLKKESRIGQWMFDKELNLEDRVDCVLVNTDGAYKQLAERLGGRVRKLPDTVDTDRFRPISFPDDLARKIGLSRDIPIVAYLGLIAPHQGTDMLIDAFSLLRQEGKKANLLLMGYPNLETAKQRIREKGLAEWATVVGPIPYEEAHRYLALGTVAVSPKTSLTEGNGKLLNYMAMGLPTVAFNTPINYELLGEAGRLTTPGNIGDLAQGIAEMLDGTDMRMEASQAGRKRAIEHFGLPVIRERISQLLEKAT